MMKESAISLDPHSIITAASEQTGGLTDTGEQFFTEGLNKACESLEQESELNATGRYMARDRLIGHTGNRLRYLEDRKLNPAIAKEKIEKPVFIIGLPRTGTTILHDILAQDLSSRVPLTWECMFPSPPPERKTYLTDPRIEKCQATFPDTFELMPEFKMMHPMGADLSQECIVMWGESMCTPLFHGQWFMPSYQDWVDQANFAPVYDFHKKQLQHLQWRCPNDRWVLKSGGHMWGLEHLLATYPDARIIFTHRDPVKYDDIRRQPLFYGGFNRE